jgi:hypothetical protein
LLHVAAIDRDAAVETQQPEQTLDDGRLAGAVDAPQATASCGATSSVK